MSGYIGTQPLPQATQTRDVFTATSGQTSFATSGYTPNFLDCWLNGVKLVNGDDFTATNGSDVVLTSGAAAGDTVEVLSYSTFEVNSQTFTGTTTLTGDLQATTATFSGTVDVGGSLIADGTELTLNGDPGNFVSATRDGAIEIRRAGGGGYIDFHGSAVDFDVRLQHTTSNGFTVEVGGAGSTKTGMEIDAAGVVKTAYQPMCVVTLGGGWFNMLSNNLYGLYNPATGFHYNRGGFYGGSVVGSGYNALHVPATGYYRVTNCVYLAANNDGGRVYVQKNGTTEVTFLQSTQSTTDNTQISQGIIYMTAGDYFNYTVIFRDMNTYHAINHTFVQIEFMG